MSADHRLAVYGTLAPGQPNHHHLSDLKGHWTTGTVKGRLVQSGWGAALGYPALVLDETGGQVAVSLFESEDLAAHWQRLDAFEGEGYRRVAAQVQTEAGERAAFVYVSAGAPSR